MEIILIEDVPNLGNMGDIVQVKPGYGRNYLIPRGFAELATRGNKKHMEHLLAKIALRRERLRGAAKEVGGALDGVSITIPRRAGEDGRLFGSVTKRDVEDAIIDLGHEVERRRILLGSPIKQLGIYKVPIELHADVKAEVQIWVAAL